MAIKAKKKKNRTVKRTAKRSTKTTRKVSRIARRVKSAKKSGRKPVSYGVKFVRKKRINEIRGPHGWHSKPGNVRTSERRFKTKKEAVQHGRRFTKIEGHKGYSVFSSRDAVNARINWRTGKTNPIVWLRRTGR